MKSQKRRRWSEKQRFGYDISFHSAHWCVPRILFTSTIVSQFQFALLTFAASLSNSIRLLPIYMLRIFINNDKSARWFSFCHKIHLYYSSLLAMCFGATATAATAASPSKTKWSQPPTHTCTCQCHCCCCCCMAAVWAYVQKLSLVKGDNIHSGHFSI